MIIQNFSDNKTYTYVEAFETKNISDSSNEYGYYYTNIYKYENIVKAIGNDMHRIDGIYVSFGYGGSFINVYELNYYTKNITS